MIFAALQFFSSCNLFGDRSKFFLQLGRYIFCIIFLVCFFRFGIFGLLGILICRTGSGFLVGRRRNDPCFYKREQSASKQEKDHKNHKNDYGSFLLWRI